jgi:hypothetical protein
VYKNIKLCSKGSACSILITFKSTSGKTMSDNYFTQTTLCVNISCVRSVVSVTVLYFTSQLQNCSRPGLSLKRESYARVLLVCLILGAAEIYTRGNGCVQLVNQSVALQLKLHCFQCLRIKYCIYLVVNFMCTFNARSFQP